MSGPSAVLPRSSPTRHVIRGTFAGVSTISSLLLSFSGDSDYADVPVYQKGRKLMQNFIVLALVGLAAQLVDGALGMAYGVTSSTLLLATGVAPAAASAAVHFSEIGTTLVSGISHHKLGNVDWRTVSIMALPGAVGAFAG